MTDPFFSFLFFLKKYSCGFSNFASRTECNKCKVTKPDNISDTPVSRAPRSVEDPTKPHEWASSRRRYEWTEEYEANADPELGLVAPPDKGLEEELFGEEYHVNTGLHFEKYAKINVTVKGTGPPPISSVTLQIICVTGSVFNA